ncbi:MAG: outer membrane beta-barrel protein [Verrucomicrobiota bacterium]
MRMLKVAVPLSESFRLGYLLRTVIAAALSALVPIVAWPQEALRNSLAGAEAAAAQARALERQDYNLKIGNAKLLANAYLGLEYNDNIRYLDAQKQQDFILHPQVNTSVTWPVTVRNVLSFSLGLGYTKYLDHSEFDYMVVTPGSQLAFDIFISDLKLTFYDRFSYYQDPGVEASVSGVAAYGGIENAAGLNVSWDLNQAILTGGYAHTVFIPDQDIFDYLTRSSELFLIQASFLPNRTISLGPEGTAALTHYDHSFLHDAVSYSAGVFVEGKLSQYIRAAMRAGYVAYDFDQNRFALVAQNPKTYYFSVSAAHTVSQYIQHTLSGGREVRLGTFADFQEQFFARYTVNWNIFRQIGLATQFSYEHGRYPAVALGTGGVTPVYVGGEEYNRIGGIVTVKYQVMEKLTSTLTYRYWLKQSDVHSRDYTQNSITVGLTYRF